MEQGGSRADPAEAARHVARLRATSFLVLVVGGLIAGLGSTLPWATSRPFGLPTRGTDTVFGIVALGAAIVAILAALLMRAGKAHRGRKSMVVLALAAGIVVAAAAGGTAAAGPDTLSERADRKQAEEYARSHNLPVAEYMKRWEAAVTHELQPGIWITLAGGILIVAGGALSVSWARAAARAEPQEPEPPAAG